MLPLRWPLLVSVILMMAAVPAVASPSSSDVGPGDVTPSPESQTSAFAQFAGEPVPAGLPVWPGVRRDERRTTLGDGKGVNVQILHIDPGADIQMTPTLAGGTVHGLATVADQSGDPFAGGVAGINGGFWLSKPTGEPNGLFIWDGRLVSDAESQGVGPRGAVGWTDTGDVMITRVESTETVTLPNGTILTVDGVNRLHRNEGEQFFDGRDSLLGYTTDFGGQIPLREPVPLNPDPEPTPTPGPGVPEIPDPESTSPPSEPTPAKLLGLRLAAPLWPASGRVLTTVIGITRDKPATFTVEGGEIILTATGARAAAFDDVQIGDEVTIGTTLHTGDADRDLRWADVRQGMAAGPHIVADGQMTDPAGWEAEGFSPTSHSGVRAPRSAIGITAEGRVLMVTADGRRAATAGFTMAELARYMLSLGATDALSLDGGASSQMVQDGVMRNRPCCDSSTRRVATSIQLRHDHTFSRSSRLAGAGRIETAIAIARDAHAAGTSNAVLATAGSFADALAGGPLASALSAPLLLSNRVGLSGATATALRQLGVNRVWVLGGEAALSSDVDEDLRQQGITVTRLAGPTRIETSVQIAREITRIRGSAARAFVVPAGTFPDALMAAAPAGILGMPILLTTNGRLHPAASDWLRGTERVTVIDADGQLSGSVTDSLQSLGAAVEVLGGRGTYATSAAVARWLATQAPLNPQVIVARGADFPDALAGGPLAAARRVPLMLIPGEFVEGHPDALAWFSSAGGEGRLQHVTVLGGVAAVSTYAQWQLEGFSE